MDQARIDTLCVHGARDANNTTGAIAVPIYQSAAFAHSGVGEADAGYDYSRLQNPTREVLEKSVAMLENGTDAIAFSSGMAAMAVLCELFAPGDHIIATDDLYGGSVRLLNGVLKKNGVLIDFVHTGKTDKVKELITPKTKALFVETPSNPMMQLTDIEEVAAICRDAGILLIVDNTFYTPIFQRPLDLGADIVLHSGTKYLGGHNDTLAGFLVTGNAAISERLRFFAKTIGACLAPFDCFLIQRGIKTLALRMEKIVYNAKHVAECLDGISKVKAVYHAEKCGMISFYVDSPETALSMLSKTKIILYAESLGGVESLMTYPILQTHADVPEDVRKRLGITDCLLRLSVGIEHVSDLITDLEDALR